jgi:hypothetical protein
MKKTPMNTDLRRELSYAKSVYEDLSKRSLGTLQELMLRHSISIIAGDIRCLNGKWYVTHSGLLKLAERRHCVGIRVISCLNLCDPSRFRWVFKATVFKSRFSKGFVGYGDADPSNVSPLVRGAEMRVAETRAVNRALRKAYGIGICSVEELGSGLDAVTGGKKPPPQPANGNGLQGHAKLRDRLLRLVREHRLDPVLVKAYAVDFCGTKALRDASREQVERFIRHLADWAEKDKNALLCQLNSYLQSQAGSGRGAA